MLDTTTNNPTKEEFHYTGAGRLVYATVAQTPSSTYTDTNLAASRAAAHDAGGRLKELSHWWQLLNTSTNTYNTDALISNTCAYEVSTGTSNANRGLKTTSNFYVQDSGTPTTFALDHQEVYGYDANLDYLTSASYDGGSTSTTWTYDAAGNRNDATVVDNLNRATTIGGVSRTYDVLGNTLTIGSSKSMTWDVLNRMLSLDNGSTTTDYAYRSDGMRVVKETGTKLTSYGYDGQMPVEESLVDSANSNNDSVIRYALGARGVDRISRTTSSGTTTGYPLYDAHGNNVATLSKSGSSYSLGDQRSYDAWGGIRAGATTGEPNGRYCANLGHLSDDESGFVYMRARYYETETGRLLCEDLARSGLNWYVYCANQPVTLLDYSGCLSLADTIATLANNDIDSAADGGGASAFERWAIESIGRYTGSHQVDIAVELVGEDAFAAEYGGGRCVGSVTRSLTRILIQLKPSGMNPATFCHEMGEALCRAVQTAFGDSFAIGHKEAEQMMVDAWRFFIGGL